MTSMDASTSKTSLIKSLLLRAWRERWDEVVWGINIKKVLPRGVSGDVYDLADCILQQALAAPSPNHLLVNYLNHCVSGQMVSYGAVLTAISKYNDWHKPNCIDCLLDLLAMYKQRIACLGNEEECIALAKSLVAIIAWLFTAVGQSLIKLAEQQQQSKQQQTTSQVHLYDSGCFQTIIEKASDFVSFISQSSFLKSLLYVGQVEDNQTFSLFVQRQAEVNEKLGTCQMANLLAKREVVDVLSNLLHKIDWVNSHPAAVAAKQLKMNNNYRVASTTFASLNAIIAFDAVLNPASDIQVCVNQIQMIAKFNDLSMSDLYCEIIRACLVGLVDASGLIEDQKQSNFVNSWAAFLFLKVPQIFLVLDSKASRSLGINYQPNDIDLGLEKLLTYSPLLDLTDYKSRQDNQECDCLQSLLNELIKVGLLDENRVQKIMAKREADKPNRNLLRTDMASHLQPVQSGAHLILKAEPTVTSILKTLDTDYSKKQDGLLSVLAHMNCKNLELILCAAAATGKLLGFTSKLVKFNEFYKSVVGENEKGSQFRALLFDITFLMLCYIVQHYGTEIITMNDETKDSFFAMWCSQYLVDSGKYKNPDVLLSNCKPNKVEVLLNQFISSSGEFKSSLVNWHEVCINTPQAIKEVLIAWEHGAISTDYVKMILDNIKRNMCSLPVVISAWLCSYINILHHEERLKPINLLQHFITPLSNDSTPTTPTVDGQSNQELKLSPGPAQEQVFYKERSTLMITIIKKMFYDLFPIPQNKSKGANLTISHGLTTKTPLGEILESNFASAHQRSWIDIRTVHNMDTLLCVGGPQWFTDILVRQVLKFDNAADLNRAVDLVFGLFHLDIEQCALALLTYVIPQYLLVESKKEFLCEPRATALMRLTVMTIYDALYEHETSFDSENKLRNSKRIGRKRHYQQEISNRCDSVVDGIDDKTSTNPIRPTKIHRTDSQSDVLDNTPFAFEQLTSDGKSAKAEILGRPIYKAISKLLRLLTAIAADTNVNHRSLIPVLFLEQLIACVKGESHKILQFMPVHLIYSLTKTMSHTMTFEFLLSICSVQTARSRKTTARALCQLAKAKRLVL